MSSQAPRAVLPGVNDDRCSVVPVGERVDTGSAPHTRSGTIIFASAWPLLHLLVVQWRYAASTKLRAWGGQQNSSAPAQHTP
jgi:hypothetical protein